MDHYTYTFTVSGDATIAVVIGGGSAQPVFYRKEVNSGWTALNVVTAYKKVNDSWVVQTDWTSVFSEQNNIKKGD